MLGKERAELDEGRANVAKMVNFGIIYGISAFGLSENLGIPRDEAQTYIDAYLARFPHVQDFIQRTIEQAEIDGYATTLFGRRRPVPELKARNRQTRGLGERLAVNFVMQGTAADMIKAAMVSLHGACATRAGRAARPPGARRAPARGRPTWRPRRAELVREEMCGAYPLDPPLAVDVGVGRRLERGEVVTSAGAAGRARAQARPARRHGRYQAAKCHESVTAGRADARHGCQTTLCRFPVAYRPGEHG